MNRTGKGSRRPEPYGGAQSVGNCPEHDMPRYLSRAMAKKAARQLGFPARHLWECGDYWHVSEQ